MHNIRTLRLKQLDKMDLTLILILTPLLYAVTCQNVLCDTFSVYPLVDP